MSTLGSRTVARKRSAVRSISRTPGRNTSALPALRRQRRARRRRRLLAPAARADRAGDRRGAPETCGLRSRSPAHRPAAPPRARHRASPTSPRCFRSGRSALCASRASAKPRSPSRLRSWNSSNSTAATPRSSGSSRIMRVNTPSVTTSIRVLRPDARIQPHAIADRVAHALAAFARHARRRRARRDPPRRQQHDFAVLRPTAASSSAGGTRVVLPAPGGATSTASPRAASAARKSGRTSSTGSMSRGLTLRACPCLAALAWPGRRRYRLAASSWERDMRMRTVGQDCRRVGAAA